MNPESQKLIIITGSNKGIGYGLLQHLAQQPDHFKFIMAVRNLQNGAKALEELSKTIPNIKDKVEVEQLDVSNSASIDKFLSTLTKKYGKVDALVNNAAIAIKSGNAAITIEQVRDIFQTNYWGTVELTEKIKPLLNKNAKIINITSNVGRLDSLKSSDLQKEFLSDTIDREKLKALAKQLYADVTANVHFEKGWLSTSPFTAELPVYSLSKVFLNIYTRILAKDEDIVNKNIQVYSCHPGWVRTDMGGPDAHLSLDEGVVTPEYVFNLPWTIDPKLQGQYFSDSKVTPLL